MTDVQIPPEVVAAFASSLVHIDWQLSFFFDEKPAHIREAIQALMASLPTEVIRARLADPSFPWANQDSTDAAKQEEARRDIIGSAIAREVNSMRIALLRAAAADKRPAPYNHSSLCDIQITEEALVDLEAFDISRKALTRNGFVFELAPTLPALNSGYWLIRNLFRESKSVSKFIRLDPLCIQPLDTYRGAEYKMWVYGVPLNWAKLSRLREDQHGRWIPDPLATPSAFTDVVWSPRLPEIHFACEEVPNQDQVAERASRYLHSIFLPSEGYFTHVDGAIRFYSPRELEARLQTHVRKAGKVGQRVKIFRAEGRIDPLTWSSLAASFFVWNYDVMRYVTGETDFPAQ
ncbi:MAG: hypothetical protein ABSG98_06215 [Anaerolineales bacterium]|jgi:hypothetical protein